MSPPEPEPILRLYPRRAQVHVGTDEPDPTQWSFCYICGGWELKVGPVFRICRECGHVYTTPDAVVMWEHLEASVLAEAGVEVATHDYGQGRDIAICPLCRHDW